MAQHAARLVNGGQRAAGLLGWIGQQAFVVALQQQEGADIARDYVQQAPPCVLRQFGALRQLVHQPQGRFQLAGIGLQPLAVQGVALRQVLAQHGGGPLAETGALQGLHPVAHGYDDIQVIEPDTLV